MEKKILIVTVLGMLIFLWLIWYEYTHAVYEYIADTIFFMVLTLAALVLYKKLDLDLWSLHCSFTMPEHLAGIIIPPSPCSGTTSPISQEYLLQRLCSSALQVVF